MSGRDPTEAEQQQHAAANLREQTPGGGARGKPGDGQATDPKSGSPALGAREGAGRRGWQPMANGPANCDAREGGSGGVAANKRGHARQQCNATYPWEQSPGEGARGKPGYTPA